ncbi:MAG: ABC transporter ATP-binding protein [Acidobacteriota bacterium]
MKAGAEDRTILDVVDVRYSYGKNRAVDGISFQVQAGEVFGLLGPNGAGKTTTLSMVAGLLQPESGQVLIFGQDVTGSSGRARSRLGVVPQDIALYDELTVGENLRFWGRVYGIGRGDLDAAVGASAHEVGLEDRLGERVSRLSGGLKRRLNLAIGLTHGPDLLLLDEPTVGIDPQARLRILDVVRSQAEGGRAVLYTSHYLEEAEQICDRLAIIDHGKVLALGTVGELRRMVGEGPVVRLRGEMTAEQMLAVADSVEGIALLGADDGAASFSARDATACSGLVRELFQTSRGIEDLRVLEPTLQTLFLKLTGRELRD